MGCCGRSWCGEGQLVCAVSVGAYENWKLGEKFHLKRELYHGVPVVNALV